MSGTKGSKDENLILTPDSFYFYRKLLSSINPGTKPSVVGTGFVFRRSGLKLPSKRGTSKESPDKDSARTSFVGDLYKS